MTSDGGNTYTYNAENEIVTAAGVTFAYDGDGKRVKKSSGKLYWTGAGSKPLAESDLGGNINEEYVYFNGRRVARADIVNNTISAVHYYFSDHLGSASVVTNADGTSIQDESDYYPFGGERVIVNADPNAYKFTGKERDTETSLDNFGARYYGSSLGRFMTPDWSGTVVPVPYALFTDPQTLNLYSYVRDNPLATADLDGHQAISSNSSNFSHLNSEPVHMPGTDFGLDLTFAIDAARAAVAVQMAQAHLQGQPTTEQAPKEQQSGSLVKEFVKQSNPLDPNSAFSQQATAIGQSLQGMVTGNLKEVADAAPNTALGMTEAAKNSPSPFAKYVGYYGTRAALVGSATAATAALGGMAFESGGFPNSNRYLRIGVGRKSGDQVFRMAGKFVEKWVKSGHIDFPFKWPL